jgi:hypothetical protein
MQPDPDVTGCVNLRALLRVRRPSLLFCFRSEASKIRMRVPASFRDADWLLTCKPFYDR